MRTFLRITAILSILTTLTLGMIAILITRSEVPCNLRVSEPALWVMLLISIVGTASTTTIGLNSNMWRAEEDLMKEKEAYYRERQRLHRISENLKTD